MTEREKKELRELRKQLKEIEDDIAYINVAINNITPKYYKILGKIDSLVSE